MAAIARSTGNSTRSCDWSPVDQTFWITDDVAERRAERSTRTRRRQEALEELAPLDDAGPDVGPRSREWRGRRDAGQQERPGDGGDDEHRPATQVQRRDRGRIADPSAQPVGLLVERVEPDEQEQAGDREDHEIGQLVADGQGHVGEQQQPDDHDGVDRPAVTEGGVARELRRPPRHAGPSTSR